MGMHDHLVHVVSNTLFDSRVQSGRTNLSSFFPKDPSLLNLDAVLAPMSKSRRGLEFQEVPGTWVRTIEAANEGTGTGMVKLTLDSLPETF